MFDYIQGKLVSSTPGSAIIETGGIGYKILIPASLFSELSAIESEVRVYTTLVVREDSHKLYGFLSVEERELFEQLTSVSGIGPKMALSLIGHLPLENLQAAVANNDTNAISRVPGIGKKTAQRLIIEMRDKFAKGSPTPADFAINVGDDPEMQKIADAMNALINLGYNQMTAQKAIKKTMAESSESIDLSTLITHALKNV